MGMAAPMFEELNSKQVMNRVQVAQMPFNWSINPYRGCAHGCSFCYARSTHTFLGLTADDTFQKHIFVKKNAPEVLRQQLEKLARRHHYDLAELSRYIGLVALGTATDPYQPIEARAQVTRRCLGVLADYQVPVTITTRSPLILRDLDILTTMNVKSVNISVSTMNKTVWRNLEPASPAPEKRLDTVQALAQEGLNAGIFLAPIIPLLTDDRESLTHVIAAAKTAAARFAMASVLRLGPEVKPWFFAVVDEHYGGLASRLQATYRASLPPKPYTEALFRKVHSIMAEHGLSRYRESGYQDASVADTRKSDKRINSASRAGGGIQLTLPI